MLCRDCETRIGDCENYVSGIVLQEDGRFPALDAVKPVSTPAGFEWQLGDTSAATTTGADDTARNAGFEWQLGDASALDVQSIARFAASVIWRASRSETYCGVTLGDKYNAEFANFLLGKAAFPASSRLLVELVNPEKPPRVDRIVVAPESTRDGGFHVHQFCMVGMWFRLIVGE